jgi:hypothetical protein
LKPSIYNPLDLFQTSNSGGIWSAIKFNEYSLRLPKTTNTYNFHVLIHLWYIHLRLRSDYDTPIYSSTINWYIYVRIPLECRVIGLKRGGFKDGSLYFQNTILLKPYVFIPKSIEKKFRSTYEWLPPKCHAFNLYPLGFVHWGHAMHTFPPKF